MGRAPFSLNAGRSILSIATAFILTSSMISIPTKAAAQNPLSSDYELLTEIYYDETNPTAVTRQTNPMEALSMEAFKSSGSKVTLPSSEELMRDSNIQETFGSVAEIQSIEFYGGSTPQDIFPDFSEPIFQDDQKQYINYSRDGYDWKLSATDKVTSTQSIATKVNFQTAYFKCTFVTGSYQTARVELANVYSIDYTITLDNAQRLDKNTIDAAVGTQDIDNEFKVKKTVCSCSLKAYGSYEITNNAPADLGFRAELTGTDGNHSLLITVEPAKMLRVRKVVKLSFTTTSQNASSFEVTLAFKKTSPNTISLAKELPYREQSDQANAIKAGDLWKMFNGDSIDSEYLIDGNVPIKDVNIDYPEQSDGSQDFDTTVTATAKKDSPEEEVFWDTFTFGTSADTYSQQVKVKAIETVEASNLQENTFLLTNAAQSESTNLATLPDNIAWINWDAPLEFRYNNHQLSAKTDAGFSFSDLYQVNDTQGINIVEVVYAKDNESKIIEKVANITYKYDITPPKPTRYTISAPDFMGPDFWLFDKNAMMTVDVSDANDQATDVSGLKPTGNSLTYYDKHDAQTVDGGSCALSPDRTSGEFKFNINGDQQTDIKGSTHVHLEDNAGNVYDGGLEGSTNIPENIRDLVIQSGNPLLSVNWVEGGEAHHGSYYNQNRRAVFTVTMPAFEYLQEADPNQVIITITTGDKNSGYVGGTTVYVTARQFAKLSNQYVQDAKDQFSYIVYFDSETDYKIDTKIVSLLPQYKAELPEELFTIDKTAPLLSVTYDNRNAKNGKYYNASRTAKITIAEHNFDVNLINLKVISTETNGTPAGSYTISGWSNSGDMHTVTVSFPQDGTYQIQEISGTDLADNAMPTFCDFEFIIDTQKPTITLSVNGEADASGHAYKDGASLAISLNDTNIDPASTIEVAAVGLNSSANPYASVPAVDATHVEYSCESPAPVAENDNHYRATIHAVDLAGNEDTKTCEWSVNRFGSVYTVNQETKDMLDKQYVKSSDAGDITIIEINPSGIDETSAVANISNGANNNDLQKGAGFQLSRSDWNNLPAYNYLIPKTNYEKDGTYQITVQSHDLAGNASSNTMENKNLDRTNAQAVTFAIDNTAPVVSFSGFNTYEIPEPSHDVTIKVEDNIALDKAVIKMSDGSETTLAADDFDPISHNATITFHEASGPQEVEVRAYDKAGNMNPEYSPSIVVSTNPFVLWVNNPIIVAITLVLLGCVIALVAYLMSRKKQQEEEQAQA